MWLNTERWTQVSEQQRAADVAKAVACAPVKAKAGVLVVMLVSGGKRARAVEPVAAWFAAAREQRVRYLCHQIGDWRYKVNDAQIVWRHLSGEYGKQMSEITQREVAVA